jgi:hypothetical protein
LDVAPCTGQAWSKPISTAVEMIAVPLLWSTGGSLLVGLRAPAHPPLIGGTGDLRVEPLDAGVRIYLAKNRRPALQQVRGEVAIRHRGYWRHGDIGLPNLLAVLAGDLCGSQNASSLVMVLTQIKRP